VAADGANDGETRTCIPARQFDDALPWSQSTVGDRVIHDLASDPVLLRGARVQVLELGDDAAIDAGGQPR
jgi:hypothetical protein